MTSEALMVRRAWTDPRTGVTYFPPSKGASEEADGRSLRKSGCIADGADRAGIDRYCFWSFSFGPQAIDGSYGGD